MQRGRGKHLARTRTKDDQTYQNRYSSPSKSMNSDSTEPNNNYMNRSEDTASVASSTEMDLLSELTKPRTDVIDKQPDSDSEKLTPDEMQKTDYPVSNASAANVNDLQEIDQRMETLMLKPKDTPKSRSEPRKIFDELEPTKTNIDPGLEINKTSNTQIQTKSSSEILGSKAKSAPKPRSSQSRKLMKPKEIVIDNNPTTRNALSNRTLEITSISDRLNPNNDLTYVDEVAPMKKRMGPEPMAINNSPERTNEDISLIAKVKINSKSRIVKPKVTCGRRPRGRPPKNPIELEEIRVEDTPSTMTDDSLSDSWMADDSISDTKDHLSSKPMPMEQKKITELKLVKSSNNPESNVTNTEQIDSTSNPKAESVYKIRGRQPKKVKEPEEFVTENNTILESTVTSSNDCLETQAIQDKLMPRKPRVRKSKSMEQKTLVKSESREINGSPEYGTENTPALIEIKTDPLSEVLQSKPTDKEGSRNPTKLITSEPTKINVTPRCEIEDLSSTLQVQADSIPETTKPIVKRGRKPRTKKSEQLIELVKINQMEINPMCETNATVFAPKMTNVTSATSKPKRTRKTKAKGSQGLVKSDAVETTINSIAIPNQTASAPLDNNKVDTSTSMTKELEIKSSVKRPTAKPSNKLKKSKTIEINNNPAIQSEFLLSQSSLRNNMLSETLKVEDYSEEKCEKLKPGTNSIVHSRRRNNNHLDTVKKLIPEDKTLDNPIPEIVKTKYPFFEKIFQPIVLLQNIAHSDILSPEQRRRLSPIKQSTKILTVKNAADTSLTTRIIKQSTLHNVIDKVSPETHKRKEKASVQCVSSITASKDEHSIPKKRRIRTKEKSRSKSKVSEVKSWDEMYKSKLVVRNSETNSRNGNETDALSSVGNEENNFYKSSPSTAISLELSKSAQSNDFGKKSTEWSILPKEIQMCPLPEMIDSIIPLDLSIRNSNESSIIQTDCPNPNDSVKEICFVSNKRQSQDINLHNTGFGSSTFNVRNLSTSFTEIDAVVDMAVSETSSKPCGNIDVCRNPKARKLSSIRSRKSVKKPVLPTTPTTAIRETKQGKERCSKTVLVKPKKSPSSETCTIKVSLHARHYFNKRRVASKKSDTVVKQEKITPTKANTESHILLNKTEHQTSKSVTCSSPERKFSETNLMTTKYQTPAERVEQSDPLTALYTSNEKNAHFGDTLKGCDTNKITTPGPTLVGFNAGPKITNVRSLPKIVTDEFLPKGTITIPSLNCSKSTTPRLLATKAKHQSYFESQGDQHQANQKFTIHQQSTHNSIVNGSQSQPTASLRNQSYALTSTSNVNVVTDTVDNLQEFIDLHGDESNKKVLERIETTEENQSPVVDQNFDSTDLWKICPELEDYFSHDDVVNNNNDTKLSKFEAPSTVQNNINDNRLCRLLTETENESSADNSTTLRSNNIPRIPEDANNLRDVFEGIAALDVDYNEMEEESSESIAPRNEPSSKKCSVIANLTTANLRNFNHISNHSKDGFSWSTDICQYYVSHGDVIRHSDKPLPNIGIETSCGATESTVESYKEFSQSASKKRKRKWIDEEKKTAFKPTKEKKLKLNRNRWSLDGQGFENVINSPRSTSVMESINSNNIETSVENAQVLKKAGCQKIIEVKKRSEHEASAAVENIQVGQSKHNDKNQKIFDGTKTSEIKKMKTPITVPEFTAVSETFEFGFENDSHLRRKLDIIQPQPAENDNSNSSIDKNGNLTSSSSSSSSSSSQSSKSMSNNDGSTHSRVSKSKHSENNVPQPRENQCQKNENTDDEMDEDCISLFAESMFTNVDQPSIFDDSNLSPLFESVKESEEKFQDMTDVGTYFDRNLQECNEAYANCIPEDENVRNVSRDVPDAFINDNRDEIIPQQLELNSNQKNPTQPMVQCFNHDLHPLTSNLQRQNRLVRTNLTEILHEKRRTSTFSTRAEGLFRGHCFAKLKQGSCNWKSCQYRHALREKLQNLGQNSPSLINEVIDHALYKGYDYFIQYIYPSVIMGLDYLNIMDLFYKLCDTGLMDADYLVNATISAVTRIGMNLHKFVTDVVDLFGEKSSAVADSILRTIDSEIEPGTYWDTCRELLIATKPSSVSITRVIRECVQTKKKLQIQDVYQNFIRRLTPEQLSSMNINLKVQFDLLLDEINLFPKYERPNQPVVSKNIHPTDRLFEINMIQDNCKEKSNTPTILSPDDAGHPNCENLLAISSTSKQFGSHKFDPQESSPLGQQTPMKNQDARSNSTASNHSFLYQRRSAIATRVGSEVIQYSPDLNVRTTEYSPNPSNSSKSSSRLHKIDNLHPPQSAFRDRHWKLHLDMNNLREALKHSEYLFALNILDKYSEMKKTLFTTTCYEMLRKNVMASAHHVKNMIKLSVRMGLNKFLNETLANLGMYMMIELCNANAWVLAYSLFKTLQYPATSTETVAAFALISAEICLANRRALKAFTILKKNNMLCANRSKWNVVSEPNDEHVRVMIINLLLDVLCQEYPDRALYIFTYLLEDQTRIYHPVDLTAHVDNLVTGISNGKCTDLISDVGRLIIENNFTLKNSVFQSLIVNIYHNDIALCRQLYRYGTWLGIYPITKLTLPLHVFIKTNWTKEEMYLVILDFLEKLSMDIGPAVDHIGPNQFAIHLVFELAPFKVQLTESDVQMSNKDELKMSKGFMKSVLQEKFNPSLKTIIAEKERFMKLQSRSVVNYLKSMIVQE